MDSIEVLQADRFEDSPRLIEFCRDSLRMVSVVYMIWLMAALLMVLAAYFPWCNSSLGSIRPALLVYYLIALVHVIFRFKTGGRANILAPDIIFLLFYTMFHLGYVTLYELGLVPSSEFVFFYESSVPQALLVVNLGLVGFLFGYELMGPKSNTPVLAQSIKIPTQYWCTLGIVVMTVALAMHLIPLSMMGPHLLFTYGYTAIQNARRYIPHTMAMFLSQSRPLMVFGMTIYLLSSALRYRKLFRSKLALGMLITFVAILVMEGDRGPILGVGAALVMVRHYFIKRIRIRYLVIFFLVTITWFAGIGMVRKVRSSIFNPSRMWQEYKYLKSQGMIDWRSPFVELGGSLNVTVRTCHDVPSTEPYWKGKSYLSAALHTIPFLQGFFIRRGWLGEFGYWPSKWVTIRYGGLEAAGLAYTVPTEGYLNFGFPGAFFELFLFGLFVRWSTVRFCRKLSAAWAFIMFGFLGAAVGAVRSHVSTITGVCFQVLVIAALLSWFCKNEAELETEQFETSRDLDGQLYAEYDSL